MTNVQLEFPSSLTMHEFFNTDAYTDLCTNPKSEQFIYRVERVVSRFGSESLLSMGRQLDDIPDDICDPVAKAAIKSAIMLALASLS